jgi:hypothetical protein
MLIATTKPLTTGGGSGAVAPAPLSFPDLKESRDADSSDR